MRKLFTLCLLVFSLSASAQWQQTGSKVRYVNGLGIPTRDTAAGVAADSSQILIRPQDSALYVKYKRTWLRVGGGGGSIAGSGTANYIPKFTSSTAIGNSQIFDNGTNVGIGTTSPVGRLHLLGAGTEMRVESNTATDGFIRYINTSGSMSFGMSGAPTNTMLLYDRTNNHNAYEYLGGASGRHSWYTANAERMRITSGGNALIGTTTDNGTDRLQVSGTIRIDNNTGGIILNRAAVTNFTGASLRTAGVGQWFVGMRENLSSNNYVIYNESGVDAVTITKANNNVLINTTTDNGTDRLQVSGSASVTSSLGIGTSPSVGALHIKTTSPRIVLDDNDNNGTASLWFRPQSASFGIRGSIELISTGSAAPTRFVIASTDTMTFRTNNVERMRVTSSGGNVLISTTTDNNTDKLQVNGSIQGTGFNQAYTAKTGTYTATTSDYFIDCTSGTFTVNLFTAVGNTGRILIIKNSGAGTITVDPNGAQTIDGAATQSLSTQWSRVHIISDGANWKIISN